MVNSNVTKVLVFCSQTYLRRQKLVKSYSLLQIILALMNQVAEFKWSLTKSNHIRITAAVGLQSPHAQLHNICKSCMHVQFVLSSYYLGNFQFEYHYMHFPAHKFCIYTSTTCMLPLVVLILLILLAV